jgi:putative two-component system response regulator
LKGEEIPLPARICAVADVFDALTSGRVYRPVGMSVQDTAEDILAGAGTRFDPRVVEAFRGARDRLEVALQEVST